MNERSPHREQEHESAYERYGRGDFRVILQATGDQVVPLRKAIQEVTGLSIDIIARIETELRGGRRDALPVFDGIPREAAESIQKKLEGAGGVATVEEMPQDDKEQRKETL